MHGYTQKIRLIRPLTVSHLSAHKPGCDDACSTETVLPWRSFTSPTHAPHADDSATLSRTTDLRHEPRISIALTRFIDHTLLGFVPPAPSVNRLAGSIIASCFRIVRLSVRACVLERRHFRPACRRLLVPNEFMPRLHTVYSLLSIHVPYRIVHKRSRRVSFRHSTLE